MTSVARRFTLHIDDYVKDDIEDMLRLNPDEADELIVILDELRGDIKLCERLVDAGYEDEQIRKVEAFHALQRERYNVYTVRFWEIDHWRVISGVDYGQHIIAVLYVMKRDENYDAVAQERVIEAYDRLGMDRLGR